MARPRYPKHTGPPPPALPPAAQTIGQVVAETIRLYGANLWWSLPLGLPLAIADPLSFERPIAERTAILAALAPLFTLAYVGACAIERRGMPPRRHWLLALVLGTVIFLPAALTLGWFVLIAVMWLGLFGWVVPVAVNELDRPLPVVRRAWELARADPIHAVGGIATLVLLFGLTRGALAWLLREQADNTLRLSVFLADVVISPVLFLGSVVVYRNLVARVGTTAEDRRRLRAEAVGRAAE